MPFGLIRYIQSIAPAGREALGQSLVGWTPLRAISMFQALRAAKCVAGPAALAAAGEASAGRHSAREPSGQRQRKWKAGARRAQAIQCSHDESLYYGSYRADRFGGGIGQRTGIDESRSVPLSDTGVKRITTFSEAHETLRDWATAENWEEATRIHKGAYFTSRENHIQEAVLQRIRQHYVSMPGYVAQHRRLCRWRSSVARTG